MIREDYQPTISKKKRLEIESLKEKVHHKPRDIPDQK